MVESPETYPRFARAAFAFVEGAGTGDDATLLKARRLFKASSALNQLRTCAVIATIAAGALRALHGPSWLEHIEVPPNLDEAP